MTEKKHGAIATLCLKESPTQGRLVQFDDVREAEFAVKGKGGHVIVTYREDHGPGVLVRLIHGKKEEHITMDPEGNLKVEERHGP